MSGRRRALVVDDEDLLRQVVVRRLASTFDVSEASSVPEALRLIEAEAPDVLVTDIVMPDGGGAEVARRALELFPSMAVVVMTGSASVEQFAEFFRMGAADFLIKPFEGHELDMTLARALHARGLRVERAFLERQGRRPDALGAIVGRSAAMETVRERIRQAAPTGETVLVTGESGVGKELVARAVHALSSRSAGPFVAVHCGALAQGLVESELFGHARGAFTGAAMARAGRFEAAQGGTIFLDEVGTMPESAQVRLLRVLQERKVQRVGESAERPVDVRVVAATNADLERDVAEGRFRADLFYRLDVIPVSVPPLRERLEDVGALSAHLLERACARLGRPPRDLSPGAVRRLMSHAWPGNVRELENALEAAVIRCGAREIVEPEDLPLRDAASAGVVLPEGGLDLDAWLAGEETAWMKLALDRADGSLAEAARLLSMSRTTFARKAKQYGIA